MEKDKTATKLLNAYNENDQYFTKITKKEGKHNKDSIKVSTRSVSNDQ